LMAGHVDILFASVLEGSGFVKAGKLKALAVSSAVRSPALPDVPTLAEAGVTGSESGSWIAMFAPTGTPHVIIDKVAADIKEIVAAADVREKLIGQGATPQSTTPTELKAIIERDRVRYGRVIVERGIKVEWYFGGRCHALRTTAFGGERLKPVCICVVRLPAC
jgi:tripartite-type tricarboxylate transporter receptor subunit TctC